MKPFPVIDQQATGANIQRLRKMRGLSVRDLQRFFGFEEPQAIYKWQRGESLPSVDNLYALGSILEVPMEQIIIPRSASLTIVKEQQESTCCSAFLMSREPGAQRTRAGSGQFVLRLSLALRKTALLRAAFGLLRICIVPEGHRALRPCIEMFFQETERWWRRFRRINGRTPCEERKNSRMMWSVPDLLNFRY